MSSLSESDVEDEARLGLIQIRGHFPKGGYDVHDGCNREAAARASVVLHRREDSDRAGGAPQGREHRGALPPRWGGADFLLPIDQ